MKLRRKLNIVIVASLVLLNAFVSAEEKFPVTLKDATGKELKFFEKPERIVSLNPSATEVLHAINAGSDLIAVTRFCPFPEFFADKESIGTILNPDVEKIVSLKPDLVFATVEGNKRTTIDSLRRAGVKVIVLDNIRSFRDIYKRIDAMGQVLQRYRESDRLTLEMKKRIERLRQKIGRKAPRTVFLQLGSNPIVTANKDTIMDEIIELAGGENIARGASMRYPKYSREAVIAADPDAIIVVSMGRSGEGALKRWRAYEGLKAVRENKIRVIDSNIICHMGPRLINGLEEIAALVHPEKFAKKTE